MYKFDSKIKNKVRPLKILTNNSSGQRTCILVDQIEQLNLKRMTIKQYRQ